MSNSRAWSRRQYAEQGAEEPRYRAADWRRHLARLNLAQNVYRGALDSRSLILDVGSGDGFGLSELYAGDMPAAAVCLDVSESKLALARTRSSTIYPVSGAADALPVRDSSVGAVVCLELLEHMDEPIKVLRDISRVLAADGKVLITVPVDSRGWRGLLRAWHRVKDWLGVKSKPREHVQIFTSEALRQLFDGAGLEIVQMRVGVFVLPFLGAVAGSSSWSKSFDAYLCRFPMDNFGFVFRGRSFAIGRQHVTALLRQSKS